MEYDEIVIKYLEGKFIKGYDWLIDKLEKDPQVIDDSSPEKVSLLKFLRGQLEAIDEFIQSDDGEAERNEQADIFGDDDIVISPDFMHPEDDDDDDDEDFGGFGF